MAVEQSIREKKVLSGFSNKCLIYKVMSSVGCLQLFSDKLQVFLSAGAF